MEKNNEIHTGHPLNLSLPNDKNIIVKGRSVGMTTNGLSHDKIQEMNQDILEVTEEILAPEKPVKNNFFSLKRYLMKKATDRLKQATARQDKRDAKAVKK